MSNNISIKEYNKLISDFEYWKARALKKERSKNFYETLYKEEKSWHMFYKEKHGKRVSEYMLLSQKYDELKEQKQEKVTFISLGEVKSLSKAKKIAEEVKKAINNEHYCNKKCFAEHVLPAIQNDYDKINHSSNLISHKFIEHWNNKLYYEYDFVDCICIVNGKLTVKFK